MVIVERAFADALYQVHPCQFIMNTDRMQVDTKIRITDPDAISLSVFMTQEEDYLTSRGFDYDSIPVAKV